MNMKKIFTYIITATAIVAAVSCNKPAAEKSEVESHFKTPGDIPSVEITEDITTDGQTAEVTFSVTGITASALDSLSIGVLVSANDPTFASPSFTKLIAPEDGVYTIDVNVTAKTTSYFRAVAANLNGTHYSDAVVVTIPDIAFHLKLDGDWYGEENSEQYGDEYKRNITIAVDAQDPTKCIIKNIEPYYQSGGYVAPTYNYVEGIVDDTKQTIVITKFSSVHLGTKTITGVDAPSYQAAQSYTDIVFQMNDKGELVRANAMATITGTGSAEDAYLGGVVYKKN